jgi:hypothetical protein
MTNMVGAYEAASCARNVRWRGDYSQFGGSTIANISGKGRAHGVVSNKAVPEIFKLEIKGERNRRRRRPYGRKVRITSESLRPIGRLIAMGFLIRARNPLRNSPFIINLQAPEPGGLGTRLRGYEASFPRGPRTPDRRARPPTKRRSQVARPGSTSRAGFC